MQKVTYSLILTAICICGVFFWGCQDKQHQNAGKKALDSSAAVVFRPDSLVECVTFLPDGSLQIDSILLYRPRGWNDPGEFHFIRFRIASGRQVWFQADMGWEGLDKPLLSVAKASIHRLNRITSDRVTILQMEPKSYLVLFFGGSFASQPGQVMIVRVGSDSVSKIFDKEFDLIDIADIESNGTYDMIGRSGYSETWEKDSVWFTSYVPNEIYALPTMVQVSKDVVQNYNLIHLGLALESDDRNFVYVSVDHKKRTLMPIDDAVKRYGY